MQLDESEILTVDVGDRLRQLRQQRSKSMRQLARLSGLSTNALSMIERGKTSPSVSTLYKLADALEVPITAFFRAEFPRQEVVFRKNGQRKSVAFPNGVWEGLGGESFTERIEPFMVTLEPGAGSGPFGMLHSGSEFVLCLEGQVHYEVENQHFQLELGDSLLFASNLRHRWHNPGQANAKVLIVLAGFEQGERPSEFHVSSGKKSESPLAKVSVEEVEAEIKV
jgi:transcriptional regulator with XRE-family HTH domain